jgi:hypothetical protein
MKTKILFLGLLLALFSVSCNKDKEENAMTVDEAMANAKIDIASDDVSDIIEGQFDATMDNATTGKSIGSENASPNLPDCVSVVRTPAIGTLITPGTLVTKTITFGTATTGCPMPNGNVLRGTILISFTFQPTATTHTINYTFDNFYHNDIKLDGTKTFTRTLSTGTNVHPIVVMTMDMTATFPNGNTLHRVGTRTREIVEGFGTPLIFADNIYRITGEWTTTFPNTTVQTSTITTPLLVKMSCVAVNKPLLVKGIITFVRNNNTATLDYGNGDCDNLAVFTINGVAHPIILGGN